MKPHHLIWALLCTWLPAVAFSQTATISGYVSDATSGETLIGANVYIKDGKQGTASNNFGFYSLKVPTGRYISVSTMWATS